MTQCERIMRHLNDFGYITPAEAFIEYGIYRLGARIFDLRRRGLRIETQMVKSKNRYNEPTKFAKYVLKEEKEVVS